MWCVAIHLYEDIFLKDSHMQSTDLMTRQEVADLLRISLRTLDNLVLRGGIPSPHSLGGRRQYFHRLQIDKWINREFNLVLEDGADAGGVPKRKGRPRKVVL